MSFRYLMLFIALSAGACACATAAPRTGEAEVRETGRGLPCFTISEREERLGGAPDFESVTVYDTSARPRAKMWTMAMPASRTFPVLFSMCIPYAGRVQSLPQTKAATLEPGKVYEVYIDVRGGAGRNRPRGYAARFCLARRDGAVSVHQIDAGAREARHGSGCGAPK